MAVRSLRCPALPIGRNHEVPGGIPRSAFRRPARPVNTVADTPDFV
jgi:hypothetical protein